MGKRVRSAAVEVPPLHVYTNCPHCGQRTKQINGALLRYWRECAGMTQRALAKQLEISGPYLSDIETNRRACSAVILAAYQAIGWLGPETNRQ